MISFLAFILMTPVEKPISLKIDGVERTGVLVMPSGSAQGKVPVVFGFHGHGGGAKQAQRSFKIEKEWPEAAVVYLQGLPTPGQLTDPEGKKNGWQGNQGDQGDRDLKFFDETLKWVKTQLKVDDKRIYTMGHSNGGGYSYLLWSTHPGLFAAVGVSAGGFRSANGAQPAPIMHIAGETDPLVKFRGQEFNIGRVRRINGCESESKPWGGVDGAAEWKAPGGNSVVMITHPGGHTYIDSATSSFVKFFKEHTRG
jgi:polyhydroxybutyrate depolymerase